MCTPFRLWEGRLPHKTKGFARVLKRDDSICAWVCACVCTCVVVAVYVCVWLCGLLWVVYVCVRLCVVVWVVVGCVWLCVVALCVAGRLRVDGLISLVFWHGDPTVVAVANVRFQASV